MTTQPRPIDRADLDLALHNARALVRPVADHAVPHDPIRVMLAAALLDLHAKLTASEAAREALRTAVRQYSQCHVCDGSGRRRNLTHSAECSQCRGTGLPEWARDALAADQTTARESAATETDEENMAERCWFREDAHNCVRERGHQGACRTKHAQPPEPVEPFEASEPFRKWVINHPYPFKPSIRDAFEAGRASEAAAHAETKADAERQYIARSGAEHELERVRAELGKCESERRYSNGWLSYLAERCGLEALATLTSEELVKGVCAELAKLREVLKDSQERGDRYHSERNHYRELALGVRRVAVPREQIAKAAFEANRGRPWEPPFPFEQAAADVREYWLRVADAVLSAEASAGQDSGTAGESSAGLPAEQGAQPQPAVPVTDNEPPEHVVVATRLPDDHPERCVYRADTEDAETEMVFERTGPQCEFPATHLSCVPYTDSPTCPEHKCRCARFVGDWSHYRAQQRAAAPSDATVTENKGPISEVEPDSAWLKRTVEELTTARPVEVTHAPGGALRVSSPGQRDHRFLEFVKSRDVDGIRDALERMDWPLRRNCITEPTPKAPEHTVLVPERLEALTARVEELELQARVMRRWANSSIPAPVWDRIEREERERSVK